MIVKIKTITFRVMIFQNNEPGLVFFNNYSNYCFFVKIWTVLKIITIIVSLILSNDNNSLSFLAVILRRTQLYWV